MTHKQANKIYQKWKNCQIEGCKINPSNNIQSAMDCLLCKKKFKVEEPQANSWYLNNIKY